MIYLRIASLFLTSISLVGGYFGKSDGLQAYGMVLKYYKRHNMKHEIRIHYLMKSTRTTTTPCTKFNSCKHEEE